jgi:DNA modification methylase
MDNQLINDNDQYALYLGDCINIMQKFPSKSIHLSIYSPPFGGLYHYSSDVRDLSNSNDYEDFFKHYEYVVNEISRITLPGRFSCVHTAEIPTGNSGGDHLLDFPGDVIKLHEKLGFKYKGRHCIWKEPLAVRNRLMTKDLAHATVVSDSINCGIASADYLLLFQKKGENKIPITHGQGLSYYAGDRKIPHDLLKYKNLKGNQIYNKYSHWIWRQYASSFWDDIRLSNVLPYKESKDEQDEKHVHPLQLDIIDRCCELRSNVGEIVLTPFMGVGSETYASVSYGRKAIGIELKKSYYNQAIKNMENAKNRFKNKSNSFNL